MATTLATRSRQVVARAREGSTTLATAVGTLWMVHVANLLMGGALLSFGIVPRTLGGLWGLLFAPFLHGSLSHLALNTVSFVLLGSITMLRNRSDFWAVSVAGALGSGLGAWMFGGAGTVHIGASGVIFAYLGFLMARGVFERSWQGLVLSGLVTWFFGSMVWGVLPLAVGVSWQAHLFGFLSGIGAAAIIGRSRRS